MTGGRDEDLPPAVQVAEDALRQSDRSDLADLLLLHTRDADGVLARLVERHLRGELDWIDGDCATCQLNNGTSFVNCQLESRETDREVQGACHAVPDLHWIRPVCRHYRPRSSDGSTG